MLIYQRYSGYYRRHFRNRFIGGTYHRKKAYVREYPQKIWPEKWY
jgi:hypothetical protein